MPSMGCLRVTQSTGIVTAIGKLERRKDCTWREDHSCSGQEGAQEEEGSMKGFLRDNGLSLLPSAESEERSPHIIYRDGFVLLTDDSKCGLTRIENISLLEAFQNATLVHFAEDKPFIRRSLAECECGLDDSIFVRASRDCIVNLSQVKQPDLLKDGGLIFVLKDGREVVFLAGKEFSFGHYEERSSYEPVLHLRKRRRKL